MNNIESEYNKLWVLTKRAFLTKEWYQQYHIYTTLLHNFGGKHTWQDRLFCKLFGHKINNSIHGESGIWLICDRCGAV